MYVQKFQYIYDGTKFRESAYCHYAVNWICNTSFIFFLKITLAGVNSKMASLKNLPVLQTNNYFHSILYRTLSSWTCVASTLCVLLEASCRSRGLCPLSARRFRFFFGGGANLIFIFSYIWRSMLKNLIILNQKPFNPVFVHRQ